MLSERIFIGSSALMFMLFCFGMFSVTTESYSVQDVEIFCLSHISA